MSAGEVDSGDTVMDFMAEERERGITIQAAATSFSWGGHSINLIDTPGHVDFTIEVERTMRVLDGAALIVDAVAGAQAQTETVWRQACAHGIPAVAFVNKMDREGADFSAAVASLEERLQLTPLAVQLPLLEPDGSFAGAIDLCSLEAVRYASPTQPGKGRRPAELDMRREALDDDAGTLAEQARAARAALVERVADLEGEGDIAELYLEESYVSSLLLSAAIRRLTLSGTAVPVLCGASLHGIGVVPLLDAITAYLPSPEERPPARLWPVGHVNAEIGIASTTLATQGDVVDDCVSVTRAARGVALAFKVQHESHSKRPLVWMRVYGGEFRAGEGLLNTRTGEVERPTKLLQMNGEDMLELSEVSEGAICAAVGLRTARTGDTLLLEPAAGCEALQLPALRVPTPVFFCAVEAESAAQQQALDRALEALSLEDPSVHVDVDRGTGQQLLGGMGELHLDVVVSRLRGQFGLRVRVGSMRVAYREGIHGEHVGESEHEAAPGSADKVKLTLAVQAWDPTSQPVKRREDNRNSRDSSDGRRKRTGGSARSEGKQQEGERGKGEGKKEVPMEDVLAGEANGVRLSSAPALRKFFQRRELRAVRDGLRASVQYGQLLGFPVYGASVALLSLHRPKGVGPELLRIAAAEALDGALEKAQPHLLEPVMKVELRTPEKHVGTVLSEITGSRRGTVLQLGQPPPLGGDPRHVLLAEVPLAGLIGYSTALRSMTAGEASLSMEFSHYAPLDPHKQQQLLLELRGY